MTTDMPKSKMKKKKFVCINCGSVSIRLVEELKDRVDDCEICNK